MSKKYFSYADIHRTVAQMAPKISDFKPDVIVAIGGGGFIPARMLRTFVRVPIVAVGLELYNDETCSKNSEMKKTQWFDVTTGTATKIPGGRVLIVDEVDDSRATVIYCIDELRKHDPSAIGVAVLHNKQKEKVSKIPEDVFYVAGTDLEDIWCVYPWDATDIDEHEAKASQN
uniref:Phosphoribosyltransferase domain-containing protein n=1 Tax=Vannella robusta TaxID=1487602 RepID=A0A7S4MKK6_9EUKA|mmetsp:Transcript_25090/g.31922  ORF Transcript_25090/g.31922 Transcript_25090/m.31922 type:complete len:173 (+) Transcript_25090:77-595(+)